MARALMSRPRLLLLDEPSLGLAPLVVHTIFEAIDEIRGEGTTILLVEQNAHAALKHSDRAYVLETGRIVMEGASTEDRKSTRLNSSHANISHAVFCLKKTTSARLLAML